MNTKKMMKLGLLLLFTLIFFNSCSPTGEKQEYFYHLNDELLEARGDSLKREAIYQRELEKYHDSRKKIFLVSSKYIKATQHNQTRLSQIPLIYDLIKVNNGEYEYIDIISNYNLAMKFEWASPKWANSCIDEAIKTCERSKKKFQLAHLYHLKGRLLYNESKFEESIFFFKKAQDLYKKNNETLFIASMYNNLAMVYSKENKPSEAIAEVQKGINLLSSKKKLNKEDSIFLYYMKGNLADYLIKTNNIKSAEDILWQNWNFCKDHQHYNMGMNTSIQLLNTIKKTKTFNVQDKIFSYLLSIKDRVEGLENRIKIYSILQKYYLKNNNHVQNKAIALQLQDLNSKYIMEKENELKINLKVADDHIIENINKEYQNEKKKNLLYTIFSIIVFIFAGGLIFSLIQSKKKQKRIDAQQQEILLSSLERIQEKVKNNVLLTHMKIEMKQALVLHLKKLRKTKKVDLEEILTDLQMKINNLISIDNRNEDFEAKNLLETTAFKARLAELYPTLNQKELNLCIHFRLNLSAKEISVLENFAEGSVRVYKVKVKSKMGLDKETNLSEHLQQI